MIQVLPTFLQEGTMQKPWGKVACNTQNDCTIMYHSPMYKRTCGCIEKMGQLAQDMELSIIIPSDSTFCLLFVLSLP